MLMFGEQNTLAMKSRVASRNSLLGSYSSAGSLQSVSWSEVERETTVDHSLSPTGFKVHQDDFQELKSSKTSYTYHGWVIGIKTVLFVLSLGFTGLFSLTMFLLLSPIFIPIWVAAEFVWTIWLWTFHIPRLARIPLNHSPGDPSYSPENAFNAFISQARLLNKDGSRVVNAKKLISSWFFDAPFSSICKGNLEECLAYGFYFMAPSEMRTRLGLDASELVERFLEAAGLTMPSGYRSDLRCLVNTMREPLKCGHRPLLFYLAMELVSVISGLYMTSVLGFKLVNLKENSSVRFYSRLTQGESKTVDERDRDPPVLLMHGIGLGLLTYLPTIVQIAADAAASNRSVLCLEIPHVSMRLSTRHIPTIRDVAEDVYAGLVDMNVSQISLLAHSYSTCVASHLLKHHSSIVHSACLIDPVCFGSYLPPRPLTGRVRFSSLRDLAMDLFVLIVIREPHQACTWYRRFYWPEATVNHLTFFPCPTVFALGGQDYMIHDVLEVKGMIEQTEARALYHPSHAHGGVLSDRDMQKDLLSYL